MRYLAGVATLKLDASKCAGCRTCTEVCPHGVLEMDGKTSRIADLDACMECGACAQNCRTGALTVEAGVGCANAIIKGALRGSKPACGCTKDSCC